MELSSTSYIVYGVLAIILLVGVVLTIRGLQRPDLLRKNRTTTTTLPPEVEEWLRDLTPEQINAARKVGIGDRRKDRRE